MNPDPEEQDRSVESLLQDSTISDLVCQEGYDYDDPNYEYDEYTFT